MRHLVAGVLVALLCLATTGVVAGSLGTYAFVTSSGSLNVIVINAATYEPSSIELGTMTHGVAVDPQGRWVYVTSAYVSGKVYVLDPSGGRVIGAFDLAKLPYPGTSPFGLAVNPEGTRVYVTHAVRSRVGAVTALNVDGAGSLSLVGTVEVGGSATGVVVGPRDNRVYVANGSGRISVIDAAAFGTVGNVSVKTIPVGDGLTGIAFSPDAGRIYVADTRGGMLWVVDPSLVGAGVDPVLGGVRVGRQPFGVAVSPDGTRVVVTNSGDNTISLITAGLLPDPSAVRPVAVGGGPHGVDITSDGRRIFVANRYDDTVMVLDSASGQPLQLIGLPRGTYPVAFGNFLLPGSKRIVVQVDVKPGGNPNVINLKSRGTTPVAILGSPGYDVTQVDVASVRLAGAPVVRKPNGAYMESFDDVNGDGLIDLVLHFDTTQMQLSPGDTQVTLEGQMTDGTPFSGTDSVRVVP